MDLVRTLRSGSRLTAYKPQPRDFWSHIFICLYEKGYPLSEKNSIRIQYLAARERMLPDVAARASAVVCETVLAGVKPQAVVAGYLPHRGEVDVRPAMRVLAERGHSLCLPVIEASDKPLFFRRWKVDAPLETGRYGIAVPEAGAPVFKPDVVLVPLVAFDRAGHRLGYGAGYYDRTIMRLRERAGTMIIGVAYASQEAAYIPPSTHDQVLDMVITDKETIRIS